MPFADLFAADLAQFDLGDGVAGTRALEMALLSPDYADLTRDTVSSSGQHAFWLSVARGNSHAATATTALERAVANGFQTKPDLPDTLGKDKLGETLLIAMALFVQGAEGNLNDMTEALTIFRALGLEDVARRAALEVLIQQEG